MTDRAKSSPPNQSQTPTDKDWRALHVDPKSWKELWKPTSDRTSAKEGQIFRGRSTHPSKLKGGAICLAFLLFFLSMAAGIAHWQTGVLGVAKGPSHGKANMVFNSGFQTFYYEAGQEIWIDYTTEIEDGFVNISIWTSDKLFSWNMIEEVFEYEITQSDTNEITWKVPQSGYYRIVFSSGKGRMPDLNGSFDRRYSAKYGIKRPNSQYLTDRVDGLAREGEEDVDTRQRKRSNLEPR